MRVSQLPIRSLVGLASLTLAIVFGAKVVPLLGPARTIDGDPVESLRQLAARGRGVPWDRLALRTRGPACDAGDLTACRSLADAYDDFLVEAPHWGLDLPECLAHELYDRACSGEEFVACHRLSRFALSGRCEPRNDVRARSLLRKACVYGGVPHACNELEHIEPS